MPVVILYFLLMLPVLTDLRVVMGDEAAYADPALRWSAGQGFTSTAWGQPPDQLWAGNFPLHAWSLAGWITATQVESLYGLRLQSLLLFCLGLLLWIYALRRHQWTTNWRQESLLACLLLTALYGAAPSQYIRPEALVPLIFGLGLLALSWSQVWWRRAGLFLTGCLASWAGLPFALALAIAALCWLLHHRLRPWVDFLACGLGGLGGLIFLYAFYQSHGVWEVFLAATLGHGENRLQQWQGWRDPMLLATTLVLGLGLALRVWSKSARPAAFWGLTLGLGLPGLFFFLSKFPNYYGIFALLPLCTATAICFPLFNRLPSTTLTSPPTNQDPRTKNQEKGRLIPEDRPPRLAPFLFQAPSLLFLAAAGLVGFPLSALLSWNTMDQRRYQPMEAWVAGQLPSGKMAFVDPAAYFAARQVTSNLVTQFGLPAFPDKDQISTLILWTDSSLSYLQAQTIQEQIGGHWEKVGSYRGANHPLRLPALAPLARLSHASPYQLEIWHKSSPPPSP